jgi:hypothetical protein
MTLHLPPMVAPSNTVALVRKVVSWVWSFLELGPQPWPASLARKRIDQTNPEVRVEGLSGT